MTPLLTVYNCSPVGSQVFSRRKKEHNKTKRKRKRRRGALLHFSLRHCVKPVWQTGSNWRDDTGVGRKGPPQHGPGLGLPESPYSWLYSWAFDCRSVCLKANDVGVCGACHLSHLHFCLPDFLSLSLFLFPLSNWFCLLLLQEFFSTLSPLSLYVCSIHWTRESFQLFIIHRCFNVAPPSSAALDTDINSRSRC